MKYTKPKVNFGNRVRISKKDIPFRKDTSQSLQMKFLKLRKIYEKASYIHHQRFRRSRSSGKIFCKKELRKCSD